uniref:TATA element modulatory factor 1 TATA binding domain-containing protein n=1 Tax=Stomoxys calcitrans TaxID=35570 RepID=A0A1I8NUV1_STOCA
MSWFDTKNFATLASKALKEAQKKIDKVLDIQEEDLLAEDGSSNPNNTSNPVESCDDIVITTVKNTGNAEPQFQSMNKETEINTPAFESDQYSLDQAMSEDHVSPEVDVSDNLKTDIDVNLPDISSESIVIINAEDNKLEYSEKNHLQDPSQTISLNEDVGRRIFTQSREDIAYELQAIDSDSTQSFEDVQIQSAKCVDEHDKKISTRPRKNCKSDITSAHTSNDEMETATSSDIEIISNPNGDGSSTASNTTRTSPSKIEKMSGSNTAVKTNSCISKSGHCREPSEISILSIDSPSEDEVEKLLKRISELNGIIEARELSLLQSEQHNSQLQERNNELMSLVGMQPSEEYTKRLSALEKKFQNCIRERDALRTEIKELQMKMPKNDLTDALAESQCMVAELRQEGEKLSKEILQQSNIIKKLRSKEKTLEVQLKTTKDQYISTNEEVERLKKTLSAKEDVERTQIEAVHKMSSENQRIDKENSLLRSKLDDTQQKLNTLQCSFDAVKCELQQRSKQQSDLSRTTMQTVEKEKLQILAEKEELERQLQEFSDKLRSSEIAAMKREQQLREENRHILDRLEAAELRAETCTQEISQSTIPLIRHLESLQQTLNQRTNKWNKDEKCLLAKLETCQERLQTLENIEETSKRKIDALKSRCQETEEKLAQAVIQEEKTKIALQLDLNQKEMEHNRKLSEALLELEKSKTKIKVLEDLQYQQYIDDAESKRSASVECLHKEREQSVTSMIELNHPLATDGNRNSPAASTTGYSLEDGGSIDWQQQEDDLDCMTHGRSLHGQGVNFHYVSNNTANNYEYLQSMLKQRDGELAQAQWELSRIQAEKSVLQEELSQLSIEMENIKEKLSSYELMEESFNDLQTRYDALLQMYGEKVERCEELELDLKECKEAYKIQIQELLAKLKT